MLQGLACGKHAPCWQKKPPVTQARLYDLTKPETMRWRSFFNILESRFHVVLVCSGSGTCWGSCLEGIKMSFPSGESSSQYIVWGKDNTHRVCECTWQEYLYLGWTLFFKPIAGFGGYILEQAMVLIHFRSADEVTICIHIIVHFFSMWIMYIFHLAIGLNNSQPSAAFSMDRFEACRCAQKSMQMVTGTWRTQWLGNAGKRWWFQWYQWISMEHMVIYVP